MNDPKALKSRDLLFAKFAKSENVIDNFTPFLRIAEANVDMFDSKDKDTLKKCQQVYATVVREESIMCRVPPLPQKNQTIDQECLHDGRKKKKKNRKSMKHNHQPVQNEEDVLLRAQFKEWTFKAESWLKSLETLKILSKDIVSLTAKLGPKIFDPVMPINPNPSSPCPSNLKSPDEQRKFLKNTPLSSLKFRELPNNMVCSCCNKAAEKSKRLVSTTPVIPKDKRIKLEATRKLGDRKGQLDDKAISESESSKKILFQNMKAIQSVKLSPKTQTNKQISNKISSPKPLKLSSTNDSLKSGSKTLEPLKLVHHQTITNIIPVTIHPQKSNKISSPKPLKLSSTNNSLKSGSKTLEPLKLVHHQTITNIIPVTIHPQKSGVAFQFKIKIEEDGVDVNNNCENNSNNSGFDNAQVSADDLDHWSMVASACAGVLEKMDLDDKEGHDKSKGDTRPTFKFDFEEWEFGCSYCPFDNDDEWITVVDRCVQCALSHDDDDFA